MGLQNKPFYREHEEKQVDSFTVRMNEEERETLEKCKEILEQPKDSSALKTLAWIGAKVLHDEKMHYVLSAVFKNKRNNKRMGIIEFE